MTVSVALVAMAGACASERVRSERRGETANGSSHAADGAAADADLEGADGAPSNQNTNENWDRSPDRLTEALIAKVRAGDDAEVVEALAELPESERQKARVAYLRGRLLERLGRLGEAAEVLKIGASELPPAVARDAVVRRIELLARSERCGEAERAMEAAAGRLGSEGARLRAALASCVQRAGRASEAIPGLRAALNKQIDGVDEFELRFRLAEALAAVEEQEEARDHLRRLLLERPEHRRQDEVEARLRELGGELELTNAERLARARRLLRRRRFSRAIRELAPSTRPERPGQRALWLHLRGMALFRSRHNYEEAAKVLGEAARFSGSRSVDDEFHAARALSRADHDDEAIKAYRRLVRDHPNHERAVEAEYLSAWLDLHHGRVRGEKRMRAFLSGPRGSRSSRLRREATWHVAFSSYERGRYAQASEYSRRYARMGHGGLVRGRGLYWQARALEALGRREPAVEVYRAVVGLEPLHWYALLARQRLVGLGEDPGHPFGEPPSAPPSAPPPLPPIPLPPEVTFYYSIGLEADALDALRARESAVRAAAPDGRGLEALVRAYHQLGGYRRAYRLVYRERDQLRRRPGPDNQWVWDASYPRPYREVVVSVARGLEVDPAHVWATMRQESGYSPRVVSHAGAIGLLQLMPATARSQLEAMGVPYQRRRLFDPEWNVRLGAGEIAEVRRSFDDNIPLAIAAYNAGEARARRWLSRWPELELDHFVERIPFNETRNYVRRVTSHLARYRYLEDPSRPWPMELTLELPEQPDQTENSDE